jgi:hypothetical protein
LTCLLGFETVQIKKFLFFVPEEEVFLIYLGVDNIDFNDINEGVALEETAKQR